MTGSVGLGPEAGGTAPRSPAARYLARLFAQSDGWELLPDPWTDGFGDDQAWSEYVARRDAAVRAHEDAMLNATTRGEAVVLLPGLLRLRLLPRYVGALRDDPSVDRDLAAIAIRAHERRWVSNDQWETWFSDWRSYRTSLDAAAARALAAPEDGGDAALRVILAGEGAAWGTAGVEDLVLSLAERAGRLGPWATRLSERLTPAGMRDALVRLDVFPDEFQRSFPRWVLSQFPLWMIRAGEGRTGPLAARDPTWTQAVRLAMLALDRLPLAERDAALRDVASEVYRLAPDDHVAFDVRDGGDPERMLRHYIAYWDTSGRAPFVVPSLGVCIDGDQVAAVFARAAEVPADEAGMRSWYRAHVLGSDGRRAAAMVRAIADVAKRDVDLVVRTVRASLAEPTARARWAVRVANDMALAGAPSEAVTRAWIDRASALERASDDAFDACAREVAIRTAELGGDTAIAGAVGLCLDLVAETAETRQTAHAPGS